MVGRRMNCGGMFCRLVLCIGVRRVLVERLGGTMCAGERRDCKHEHEQRRGRDPLHAKNVALTTWQAVGYQSTCTK